MLKGSATVPRRRLFPFVIWICSPAFSLESGATEHALHLLPSAELSEPNFRPWKMVGRLSVNDHQQ